MMIPLTTAWQKIAGTGSTIEVQNPSLSALAYIITSAAQPPATDIGIKLSSEDDHRVLTLTLDLWARAANAPLTLVLMGGFSLGSTSSGNTPASSPGGGPNNIADFADSNNAALAAEI